MVRAAKVAALGPVLVIVKTQVMLLPATEEDGAVAVSCNSAI